MYYVLHLLFGLSGDSLLPDQLEERRREETGVKLVMSINVTHIKRGLAALMAIAKSHEEIRNTVHILGSTQHKFPT